MYFARSDLICCKTVLIYYQRQRTLRGSKGRRMEEGTQQTVINYRQVEAAGAYKEGSVRKNGIEAKRIFDWFICCWR